jgi:transcriptional regulator with XRE-family HTH domain
MPRRERSKLEREVLKDKWRPIGMWLAQRREQAGLTQDKAARLAGISRRQWIRYEQGAVISEKRMKALVKVVRARSDSALQRAGYKTSPKRNGYRERVENVYDMLRAGGLEGGLDALFSLYLWMEMDKGEAPPETDGTTAANFARAINLLITLPEWLLAIAIKCMQNHLQIEKQGSKLPLMVRLKVIERALDLLGYPSLEFRYPSPKQDNRGSDA